MLDDVIIEEMLEGGAKNDWHWCSLGLEPDYVNCKTCTSGYNSENCHHCHNFHTDAVRWCDEKRKVQGLPLIGDDFDLLKENFKRKELAEKSSREKTTPKQMMDNHSQIDIERVEEEWQKKIQQLQYGRKKSDSYLLGGVGVCLLLGIPVAYIGQLFQLFTMFVFDTITLFFSGGHHPEVWSESFNDSFYYAEFPNRYFYWTSLMIAAWSWIDYHPKRKSEGIELHLRIIGTGLFIIASLLNFNLFISSIFGPLFLIYGLAITAKR